jgi:hypothetical protein
MIIKLLRHGRMETIEDATLLIVEDQFGNPVSLAACFGPGDSFAVSCIGNEVEFNKMLRNLGINKIVTKVSADKLLLPPDQLPHTGFQS